MSEIDLDENLLSSSLSDDSTASTRRTGTTQPLPTPPVDYGRKIQFVLGVVGVCAVTLSLYGGWCVGNSSVCPPVLLNTTASTIMSNASTIPLSPGNNNNNNNGSGSQVDANAVGVGILMIIIGVATLIPVLIVAVLQSCLNIGSMIGTQRQDLLRMGHTEKSIRIKQTAVAMMFASHFLSAWGDRMWQFAVPLLFMEIFVDTLAPTAIYALIVYSACVQFMPSVGGWVDRQHRLIVQRFALLVDNASVFGTSVLLCLLAASQPSLGQQRPTWDMGLIVTFVGVLILGVSGELMNQAQTLAIERDWVVVIANEIGSVPIMNTWMRRIDLSCKALAPWAVGLMIQSVGKSGRMRVFYGAAAVGVWNAMAYPLELMLTTAVFYAFPALEDKIHHHEDGTKHSHTNGHKDHSHFVHRHIMRNDSSNSIDSIDSIDSTDLSGAKSQETQISAAAEVEEKIIASDVSEAHWHDVQHHSHHSHHDNQDSQDSHNQDNHDSHKVQQVQQDHHDHHGKIQHNHASEGKGNIYLGDAHLTGGLAHMGSSQKNAFSTFVRGFRGLFGHKVLLASIAYSSLWCSVLDNGALMTAYLVWRNVELDVIGTWRGIGAIFGLVGTLLFPRLMKLFGGSYEKSGLVSLWIFWLLLSPGLIAFFVSGQSVASDYTVMISMAVSRIGLWSFDLAETQIMQTYIVEEERGILNSTQTSLYQAFYVLMQLGGIIFSHPSQFSVLVYISIFVVLGACCLYTYWYNKYKHE